ncbi:MAG TPA: zinc-binding dehydrogenase, partial [Bacteroidota bacterium]
DPPFVPGIEFSGVVERTGSKVRGIRKGDRVAGFSKQGSYAELVCTEASHVVRLTAGMSFEVGAALPVAYLSAYHGLVTLANAQKDEKLLIHAAAGGVGIASIQIATHLGMEIFGTVGSDEKAKVAARAGADHVINYRTEDFSERVRERTNGYGLDVVMDSVGGSVLRKGWKLLAPMGRYVLYGFASVTGKGGLNRLKMYKEALKAPLIFPPFLPSRNVSLMGFNLYFLTHKKAYLERATKQIMAWYRKKIIKPLIGATFGFDEIVTAHEYLQTRQSVGKVVVKVS